MDTPVKAQPATDGQVDVDAILGKIKVPPNLEQIYDKAVLSGMRIMFDSKSHAMMLTELQKPGPLAPKIVEGILALIYMLWRQSNQTLPPQIILPLTMALTLKCFEFLQRSGEPDATSEVLGQALQGVIPAVMKKFGVTPGQSAQQPPVPGVEPAAAAAPSPGGVLASPGGDANA